MYDFVKDNDVKLSTHLQKNLTKKYNSNDRFTLSGTLVRPSTVGASIDQRPLNSNAQQQSAKALGRQFRSKIRK